jgi:hypothetical protein
VSDYVELNSDEVIQEGDMRVRNGQMLPVSMSYIGKQASDYAPLTVVRPRSTLICDAAVALASRMYREGYYRIEELEALREALDMSVKELRGEA